MLLLLLHTRFMVLLLAKKQEVLNKAKTKTDYTANWLILPDNELAASGGGNG